MKEISGEIKQEWKTYTLQIIGAVLLFASWFLLLYREIGFSYLCLFGAGIIDLYLVIFPKADTISQWIHRQFVHLVDNMLMLGMAIVTAVVLKDWVDINFYELLLCSIIFLVKGHLFWHGD